MNRGNAKARQLAVFLLVSTVPCGCQWVIGYEESARECEAAAECRQSVGFGFTCSHEGRCVEVAVPARCQATYPDDLLTNPNRYKDAIVFGSMMDRSSPQEAARENAAVLAVKQVWSEPALDGRRFAVVLCNVEQDIRYDDSSVERAAIDSARWLVDELGVPAIVGPSGSEATAAVYQALVGTETLVISPAATSPALTSLDTSSGTDESPGLLWRTAPSAATQVAVMTEDMASRGIGNVAVIHESEESGTGLATIFEQAFGGQVARYAFGTDSQRAEAIVTAADSAADEVLFISSHADDIVAFLNGVAADSKYDTKSFFLTDHAASRDVFLDAMSAQSLFPRIRGVRFRVPDGRYAHDSFVSAYSGEFGSDVSELSFTAHAYDATWLVMYGSAWSLYRHGSVDGRGIAQGLRKVSCMTDGATLPCNAGPLQIISSSWGPVVERFRTGTAVELEGASGDLDFDLATEEVTAQIEIWVVETNGEVIPDQ